MLHLQCHIGLDSLRWAKQGARVTGVDFSPRAIAEACSLSARSGIPARFVESSVEALPRNLKGRFDVVISVYGVTCWLPNLARWAKVIRHFLKPGGFFYLAEIHPFWNATTYSKRTGSLQFADSYFPCGPVRSVIRRGTYANPGVPRKHLVEVGWQHSLADTVGALLGAGLKLDYLHEWPYAYTELTAWTGRRLMHRDRRGFWHLKGWEGRLPLMFSVKARRRD